MNEYGELLEKMEKVEMDEDKKESIDESKEDVEDSTDEKKETIDESKEEKESNDE